MLTYKIVLPNVLWTFWIRHRKQDICLISAQTKGSFDGPTSYHLLAAENIFIYTILDKANICIDFPLFEKMNKIVFVEGNISPDCVHIECDCKLHFIWIDCGIRHRLLFSFSVPRLVGRGRPQRKEGGRPSEWIWRWGKRQGGEWEGVWACLIAD